MVKIGCKVTRKNLTYPSNEGFDKFNDLRVKGYRELYFKSMGNWGLINPHDKKIVLYSKGDLDIIKCSNKKTLLNQAKQWIEVKKANKIIS